MTAVVGTCWFCRGFGRKSHCLIGSKTVYLMIIWFLLPTGTFCGVGTVWFRLFRPKILASRRVRSKEAVSVAVRCDVLARFFLFQLVASRRVASRWKRPSLTRHDTRCIVNQALQSVSYRPLGPRFYSSAPVRTPAYTSTCSSTAK